MRLSQRLIAASIVVALSAALAGCSSNFGSNFDPMDMFDFLDTKKKLPGERKPVFPEGVPGLEQGVPKELYKGAQEQQPDPNAQTAAVAPAPPPVEEPAPKKLKGKKAKQPATAAPDAAQQPAAEQHGVVARSALRPEQSRARRHAAQRVDDLPHRLRPLVGDDDVGGGGVHGLPFDVQPVEPGPVGGQGTTGSLAAPPGRVRIDVDPGHDVAGERGADAFRAERAAAERHHPGLRLGQELKDDALLGFPEDGFPVLGEDLLDRLPDALLDHLVGVDGGHSQRGRRAPGGRRLPGAHEADQRHRALGHGVRACHPIRSR